MNYNNQNKPRQIWRRQGHRRFVESTVVFTLLLLLRGFDAFEYSSRPISSVLTRRHSTCTSGVNINGYPRHQLALAKKNDMTSEEKHRKKGRKGFAPLAQQMVDSGEAATLAEAYSLIASRGSRAAAQKLVYNGEAETIEEAYQLGAARAREAFKDKYTEKEIAELSKKAGVIGAIKQGKYTKYPGVMYHKPSGKWRVRVYNKGKRVHVGYYSSEIGGAKAHDEYVRKHGLKRRCYFPREGETSIQSS